MAQGPDRVAELQRGIAELSPSELLLVTGSALGLASQAMGALREVTRRPDLSGEMTSLQYALEAYRENSYDPERVTEAWQAFLPDIAVPECDWAEDRIRKPLTGFRGELYTPLMVPSVASLQGRNGLVRLGQMFPGISLDTGAKRPITKS